MKGVRQLTGRKLLLADDSITIQKVVNLTFIDEGIEVVTVGDGDTAVQRIPDEMPDLVMADVNMPGLNGYEVCELVRSDKRTCHIPVILLIGAFEQFDEQEAARVGATAHLTKPFQSIRQLVNQVTDLIEASKRSNLPEPGPELDSLPSEVEVLLDNSASNPFEGQALSQFDTFREDRIASIDHPNDPHSDPSADLSTSLDQPLAPEPEADDIEQLYRQSIGEDQVFGKEDFPDLGLDDEMIETSYSSPQAGNDDLDLGLSFTEEETEPEGEAITRISEAPLETQPLVQRETSNSRVADVPTADQSEPKRSDETIRLDPAMVDAQMAEANRLLEPIEPPSPPSGEFARPIGEDTIRMDLRFDTEGLRTSEFDELDLLDIPSETPVEITTPSEAVAMGGKQIVTLSPDLIEMIAQRVVEKLSEKYK